jgi:HSP20 family protein
MYPSLTRFTGDAFAEIEGLQRQIDRLFGGQPSSIRAAQRGAFPAINMGVTPEAIEIDAFAPGLDPAKVDVSVDKGLLTITGERPAEKVQRSDKVSVYAEERFTGPFRRVVSLPEDADSARVEATYRDGVLKIVVPKREASKPKRVAIQA